MSEELNGPMSWAWLSSLEAQRVMSLEASGLQETEVEVGVLLQGVVPSG